MDLEPFKHFQMVHVPPNEPFGANVLPVGSSLIVNAAFPKSLALIWELAVDGPVIPVNISEFGKAEAGPTCMSVLFR
jgi:dimethylargininase